MRLGQIDFVRGLAVLCMVELHVFDAFAAPPARHGLFADTMYFFGGGAAPLFLSLAGLSAAFVFPRPNARRTLVARGLEVWSIGVLFRLTEWALGGVGSSSQMVLRCDVLNCIGLSLVICALVGTTLRRLSPRHAPALTGLMGAATLLVTPVVAKAPALALLPVPLRNYLGGDPNLALFPLFPWAGFALLGAAFGMVAVASKSTEYTLTRNAWRLLALYAAIFTLRQVFAGPLGFQRTNQDPIFSLERLSLSLGLLAPAAALLKTSLGARIEPPIRLLGQHSLLAYWAHVDLCYGLLLHGLKRLLPAPLVLLLYAAMCLLVYGVLRGFVELRRTLGQKVAWQ